jgi:hypothetical protein
MMMFHEFLAQFEDGAEYIKRQNPKFGLRWVTWPTNTFLAAVAWRNHPPAEGTPATVANAVGNLNRVRQLKRNAKHPHRSTGGHGHDGPKPTAPRAAADTTLAPAPVTGNGRQSAVPAVAISIPTRPSRVTPVEAETDSPEIRVPATEATVLAWAATWVKMCTDDDLWAGPLTDDVRAKSRYGRSARQLRRLRQAVLSGALRRQAEELGVTLPEEYRDQPASVNRNTRDDDEPA